MYGRLIIFMVATLLGLAAVAFFLNWMWARAFGTATRAQPQKQMSKAEIAESRKEAREEYEERHAEKIRSEKHSEAAIAAASHSSIRQLTSKEFDPATGTIHWPKVLSQPRFRDERQAVEGLAKHAVGATDSAPHAKMRSAVDDFHASLKAAIRDLPSSDYVEGKHFLDSLSEWARERAEQ